MPPTIPGNEEEYLDDFVKFILGLGEWDKDYIFELVGPDFISFIPRRLYIARVSRKHEDWDELSLYDQGEIIAVERIDSLERLAAEHLVKVHYAKKETFGSSGGGGSFKPPESKRKDYTKPAK